MTVNSAEDLDQSLQRYLAEAKGHVTKMAVFAFVVCLLPLAPVLLQVVFLWLLIVPLAAAAFVGKGMQSVLLVKQQSVACIKGTAPTKMKLTALQKQFLWWNSVSSPGYKVNLSSIDGSSSAVQNLKVDPANGIAVEKMADLLAKFEQAKEANGEIPAVEVELYLDNKRPAALVINGNLLWAAYWW
ncbi:hypothetical protein BH11CYA1_BH11CYA1_01960 [soil metagenome]